VLPRPADILGVNSCDGPLVQEAEDQPCVGLPRSRRGSPPARVSGCGPKVAALSGQCNVCAVLHRNTCLVVDTGGSGTPKIWRWVMEGL
jgi:hypothetical protein